MRNDEDDGLVVIRAYEPISFPKDEIQEFAGGLVRYRTMSRAEFALEFPEIRPPK